MASFVWYDVMTQDPKAAASFYHEVIGWDAKDSGIPDTEYIIFSHEDVGIGGCMAIPSDAQARGAGPCWTGYIGVSDVDAYAARVKDAGGSIHREPQDIPGVGRFAVAADPQGAVFILFSAIDTTQRPKNVAPGTPGHIGWHELQTSDYEAAFTFYETLFGWKKAEAMDMGPMGVYQQFITDNMPVGGMLNFVCASPRAFWSYYINVADIDAASDRVRNNGGEVTQEPTEVPGGIWILHCHDPQGASFAMVGPRHGGLS